MCVCVCMYESEFTSLPLSLSRDVLDDAPFTQSLITLASKPITYQLQETGPSHCSSFSSSLPPPPCPTSSHPTPQPQAPLPGQKEQHNTVDSEDTAGSLGNRPQTPSSLNTERVPADLSEEVLLNTLQNLMMEAVRGELVLTAHPRTVILPPASTR